MRSLHGMARGERGTSGSEILWILFVRGPFDALRMESGQIVAHKRSSNARVMPMSVATASAAQQTARSEIAVKQNHPVSRRVDVLVMTVAVVLPLLILGIVWWMSPVALDIRDGLETIIPSLLGAMLVVSTFVERVVEVFVAVWRHPQAAIHEQNLDFWRARHARLTQDIQALIAERNGVPAPDAARKEAIDQLLMDKRNDVAAAVNGIDIEEKALLPFQSTTRRVSVTIGLVVGILAAAVGFRFLAQLVKFDPTLSAPQRAWFAVVDVLLTGAVLSGGSQLIHQIFSVYSAFMESTRKAAATRSTP